MSRRSIVRQKSAIRLVFDLVRQEIPDYDVPFMFFLIVNFESRDDAARAKDETLDLVKRHLHFACKPGPWLQDLVDALQDPGTRAAGFRGPALLMRYEGSG
jgi:hypothetical protein